MALKRKVIITAAITGGVHTPTMSPHLPVTPDTIAEQAIGAAEAGAAILHLHARDEVGKPASAPEYYMAYLPRVKQATDAVINITTGGGLGMTLDQRLAAALAVKPELCSLNMGSMNFVISHLAEKYPSFKHPWERDYLAGTWDLVYKNTFKDIETIASTLSRECGTRFEFECYDVGHLYALAHFAEKGTVEPPFMVQTIFGVLGGIGAHPSHLLHMRETADRLFGDTYLWSVLCAGRAQFPLLTQAVAMGANVRVGLEDNLYLGPGRLAKNSGEQVAKIRRIIEELSLEIATPGEARAMLNLKGSDRVTF